MKLTYAQSQYKLGLILAFGALLWNGTYNALAKGLTPFLSPISLLLLSEALTVFFILVTFGMVPMWKEFRKMDAKTIRMSAFVGLLNSVVAPLLFFTGLTRTSAINASILSSVDVVCVLLAGTLILKERVSRMQMIGGGIVVLGILVINLASSGVSSSIHMGDIFILVGAMVSGFGSVLFKKYLSHVIPELAILIRNIAAIIVVSVIGVFVQVSFSQEVAAFPASQILLLLAFAFFSRYLNLLFFYESLNRLPVTTLSLIQVGTPVAGIFFAALILGEQVHSYQILGGAFIMFGLMIEQVSGNALRSIRTHSSFFHLPIMKRKQTVGGNIRMLPKNI